MIKLVCPECQRENEPERIYCHDCGARLDRSSLAKEIPKQEPASETQRRLRAMLDPQRVKMRLMFFKISKLILGSCAMAALIQMVLPPDLPPRAKFGEFPPQITLDLENASRTPGAAPLRYTEPQVNAFLVNSLKSKQATLNGFLQFERAIVGFEENLCRITVGRSIYGYSVYASAENNFAIQDGNISVVNRGGAIGRLPIHPALMKFSGVIFGDVSKALDHERKLLAKMASIEFHPQAVVVVPRT